MARVLLDAGSLVNSDVRQIDRGRTPIQCAVEMGNLEICEILIQAGADINAPPAIESGATALQIAAIKGTIVIAKKLLEQGAKVNASGARTWGRTALEGAAENGRIDMIDLLIRHGAEITGPGRRQYVRSIKFAEKRGHVTAAKLLRTYRPWTDDDERIFLHPNILEEDGCWEDEVQLSDDHCQYDSFDEDIEDSDENEIVHAEREGNGENSNGYEGEGMDEERVVTELSDCENADCPSNERETFGQRSESELITTHHNLTAHLGNASTVEYEPLDNAFVCDPLAEGMTGSIDPPWWDDYIIDADLI